MSDVSPTEDLMREHGLLDRVLLIYDELAERLSPTYGSFRLTCEIALAWEAAEIIRAYIEGFHEELEEQFVFPVMKAKGLAGLVKTLDTQHNAGREITKAIQALTRADMRGALRDQREQLADMLRSFTRMYRPHAAREDTVLFREFRDGLADVTLTELSHEFALVGEYENAVVGECAGFEKPRGHFRHDDGLAETGREYELSTAGLLERVEEAITGVALIVA